MPTKKKILIVDDERDYACVLKERLEFEGFDVSVAYDGPAGLDLRNKVQPDVILLDIMMPGMDGFDFVRALREKNAKAVTSVILVTAFGRDLNDEQGGLIGKLPIIRKPFEMDELLEAIGRVGH